MNRRRTGNRIERGSASGARFAAAATPSGGEAVREPWRRKRKGIVVACRLTPKGGRDAIEGFGALADGSRALLARVRAAPENGRANRALCELIASALGVPASRVTILAGAAARAKRIAVAGDPEALIARLRAL
jgi:uncharacterized protein